MSSYIVQPGDILLIPSASTYGMTPLTVEWQQSFSDRKASYHSGLVQVKGKQDAKVLTFVASEWYVESGSLPGAHISKAATKVGDFYELKVDDKVRYGQKNAQGEARFIVYHDTSRNPYQHRFMNPALRTVALGLGQAVAAIFGVPGILSQAGADQVNALLGDPLRKF